MATKYKTTNNRPANLYDIAGRKRYRPTKNDTDDLVTSIYGRGGGSNSGRGNIGAVPLGTLINHGDKKVRHGGHMIVMGKPEDWKEKAACRPHDVDDFYIERGEGNDKVKAAKATCQTCPVRGECLLYSLTESFGIWAGFNPKTLKSIKTQVKKGKSLKAAVHHVTGIPTSHLKWIKK